MSTWAAHGQRKAHNELPKEAKVTWIPRNVLGPFPQHGAWLKQTTRDYAQRTTGKARRSPHTHRFLRSQCCLQQSLVLHSSVWFKHHRELC